MKDQNGTWAAAATIIPVEPIVDVRPLAGQISLTWSTDSVVATITVALSEGMKRITVDWGDGSTSSLVSRPGEIPDVLDHQHNPLPAGSYTLTHAYEAPSDRLPFEYYALVRVRDWSGGDEIRFVKLSLVPRYRVTNYRLYVGLTGPCDPPGQATSEFDIVQLVEGTRRAQWHWEPSNNFFTGEPSYRLDNSGIVRELTAADLSVAVTFVFTETDFGPNDVLRFGAWMNAGMDSERVEERVKQSDGNCELIVRYDREVRLIVPLPANGDDPVFA